MHKIGQSIVSLVFFIGQLRVLVNETVERPQQVLQAVDVIAYLEDMLPT